MTPRPPTDAQLAAGLRAHLPVANAGLRERILAEVTTTPQQRRPPSILGRVTDADPMARRRMVLLVAAVALALSVAVTAIAGALMRAQRTPDLSLIPPVDPPAVVRPTPDASPRPPTPTQDAGEIVHGWPHTTENGAGVYSWDGSSCSGAFCVHGFMHNGYGSGDVEIRIRPGGSIPDEGATAVTVAGHDGFYRRIDDRREEWVAFIQGKTIAIHLEARPGTSAADLAEAHAIIASMRTEFWTNGRGFRLVFRLTTDDWDSG